MNRKSFQFTAWQNGPVHLNREEHFLLNPTLTFQLSSELRRKNLSLSSGFPQGEGGFELLSAVLRRVLGDETALEDLSPELVELGVACGLFVKLSQTPRPLDSFECKPSKLEQRAETPRQRVEVIVQEESLWPEKMRVPQEAKNPMDPPLWGTFSKKRPVLWIWDPRGCLSFPTWIDEKDLEQVKAFLSSETLQAHRAEFESLKVSRPSFDMASLRRQLEVRKYAILPSVVHPLFLAAMQAFQAKVRESGFYKTDEAQVVGGRDGVYCDIASRFLQEGLAHLVSQVVEESVLPTYTYVYRYRKGSVLNPHRDRKQCRWNVSLCLQIEPLPDVEDHRWPLWIEGDPVQLGPGDAIIYSGSEVEHWREELTQAKACTFALLHYVNESFRSTRR